MEVLRTLYRINIEKIETINSKSTEWKKVADTGNEHDKGAKYDYVICEMEKDNTTEILSQELPEIDIPKVIKAINNL